MDIKTREERSRNMAAIRSENTKPEVFLRKLLFAKGYRYRLHKKDIPGKPDIYLAKYKTAILVNGCFWHRHENCKIAYTPKSNTEFWKQKFQANIERDARQKIQRDEMKIRTLIVWECTIKKMEADEKICSEILLQITEFLNDESRRYMEL